ncbi:MAG: hypothetical protein ABMA25_21645 [Ilumatobacteraceae bacterium]
MGYGLLASSLFYGIVKESSGPWKNDRGPIWVTLTGIAVWVLVGLLAWLIVRRWWPTNPARSPRAQTHLDVSHAGRSDDSRHEVTPDGA